MLRTVTDQMRDIERLLALEGAVPEDGKALLRGIQQSQESNTLTPRVAEFLRANPELLGTLSGKSGPALKQLLETPGGIEALGSGLLKKLPDAQGTILDILRAQSKVSNDLSRLFDATNAKMRVTEAELKKLVKLATPKKGG